MDLDLNAVEQLLAGIFTGQKYVHVDDILLGFKFPSNNLKQRANVVYERAFVEAVDNGMLPLKELEILVDKRNLITTKEISELKKKGNCHAVKFGNRILRTETAAVSAITAAQLLWGDLL